MAKQVASFLGIVAFVGAACSSSKEDTPRCTIEGTYTMSATPETQSDACGGLKPTTTTVTITAHPLGQAGPDFGLELQGVSGACAANQVDTCKLQAKCDVPVSDALDPTNATGTLQFSWTFDASGFKGLNSGSIPPATSLPKGCTYTASAMATRR